VVESFLELEKAANSVGLKVNGDKTKSMLSTPTHTEIDQSITIGPYNIEVVKNFVYLGSEITSKNDVSAEVSRRIVMANRCLGGLRKLLRSKHLSRKTKIQLYHQLIQPVLLYGAETWSLKTTDEKSLLVFERKILRTIYGPVCENGEWRIRYNHELQHLYQHADIVKKLLARRLRLAGHIIRMEPNMPPKKVFSSNPVGDRRPGRPKTRWADLVAEDVRKLRIPNWRTQALDRATWRNFVNQADSG